jgi:hypothetical protein
VWWQTYIIYSSFRQIQTRNIPAFTIFNLNYTCVSYQCNRPHTGHMFQPEPSLSIPQSVQALFHPLQSLPSSQPFSCIEARRRLLAFLYTVILLTSVSCGRSSTYQNTDPGFVDLAGTTFPFLGEVLVLEPVDFPLVKEILLLQPVTFPFLL